jgi:hypothetical protein
VLDGPNIVATACEPILRIERGLDKSCHNPIGTCRIRDFVGFRCSSEMGSEQTSLACASSYCHGGPDTCGRPSPCAAVAWRAIAWT